MKKGIWPYVLPPLVIVVLIWLSTIAFNLLSAPSDSKVFLGVLLLIVLFAIVYKFILSLIKK